jgi:L-ribulokinase
MTKKNYCIGVDYGTDSVRAIMVDADNGDELATSVFEYPRWKAGLYCDPSNNRFRQHPLDYIEGLEYTIGELKKRCPGEVDQIRSISIDTTGSTPVAVDATGLPLSLTAKFQEDPDAMFILWKDHTAVYEADQINDLCKSWLTDYSKFSGGIYSSEWFWAKILHVVSHNPAVARAAYSWVEHCDWMPALLTGQTDPRNMKRSRCAAGHKAMWNSAWDGLPEESFLATLSPELKGLRDRLYTETFANDIPVGFLSPEWAKRLGLHTSVSVGVGAFDAHVGAVGGEIQPYLLSKVIGTSTCDMLVAPSDDLRDVVVRGISGQVDGSIIPGMLGMEAGQSAFGDIYAWFRDLLSWSLKILPGVTEDQYLQAKSLVITELSNKASEIPVGKSDIVAIDWLNGRRTPDANQHLKGAISGLTLGTDAPRYFKALVESTAFGARMIIDRFTEQGLPIKGILALGGVAKKSPYVMQVLADVLNMPIKVVRSEHTCALGAAMFASVVAGIHPNIFAAQKAMGKGFDMIYEPRSSFVSDYSSLYNEYKLLGQFIEGRSIKRETTA